jgi:hypothetical protein
MIGSSRLYRQSSYHLVATPPKKEATGMAYAIVQDVKITADVL